MRVFVPHLPEHDVRELVSCVQPHGGSSAAVEAALLPFLPPVPAALPSSERRGGGRRSDGAAVRIGIQALEGGLGLRAALMSIGGGVTEMEAKDRGEAVRERREEGC